MKTKKNESIVPRVPVRPTRSVLRNSINKSPQKKQKRGNIKNISKIARSILRFPSFAASRNNGSSEKSRQSIHSRKQVKNRISIASIPDSPVSQSVSKCYYKTKTGRTNGSTNLRNQDAFIISSQLKDEQNSYLFGVFDGYGPSGHMVSAFFRENVPKHLDGYLDDLELVSSVRQGVLETVSSLERSSLDTEFSGSNMNLLVIKNKTLVCASIGDFKAVIGRLVNNQWVAAELSSCPKIFDTDGRHRAFHRNRRILPSINIHETPSKHDQGHDLTELSMSRNIRNSFTPTGGGSYTPQFRSQQISCDDKFAVLASDGIWKVLSSQEVVEMAGEAIKDENLSCKKIVKEAERRWTTDEETVEDITIIIILFI